MQNSPMRPRWLELARRFQALAQSGLAYCKDPSQEFGSRLELIVCQACELFSALVYRVQCMVPRKIPDS